MNLCSPARALREATASRAFALVRSIGSLSLGLSLVGCSLAYCGEDAFSRERDLRHGEIAGTARLPGPGEKPAAFVQARMQGTSFVRRTNSEGRFVFSGLEAGPWIVTVSEDDNGDGKAERRSIVSTTLRTVLHRTSPSYVPLVGGEGEPRLAGVDVGPVVLEGTVRVAGTVLLDDAGTVLPPSQHGRVAVVVAGRNLDLPRLEDDGSDLVSLGAEVKTGVDAHGDFVLRNVSGGDFYLLVLFYELGTPGQPGALLHVSEPIAFTAVDDDLDILEDIVIPATALVERRPAQLVFSPAPAAGDVYLVLVPPGRELPPCEDAPIDYSGTDFAYALTTAQIPASATPQFQDVPVGLWDMQACFTSAPSGTLFAQTITPPVDGEPPVLLGPVLLSDLPTCVPSRPCDAETACAEGFTCDESAGRCVAPEGWSDCDGDDTRGLPRIENDDDRALWASCVSACFAGAGAAAADTTCQAADGNTYDCDDDGDGQPDVTESQDCYGVGRGTDSDGDGICDGVDPFPECRANTAAACEAGAEPDTPSVPADYVGEGPGPDECEAERAPSDGAFCAAVGIASSTEQCSQRAMSCTIDTQFRGPNVVVPRCDATTGLGCESQQNLFCATDLARDDGVAPCAQRLESPCEVGVEGGCPEPFVCALVDVDGSTQPACVSDLSSPDFELPVYSQVDCTCCPPGEECHVVPHTRDVQFPGACTDREMGELWDACLSGAGQVDPGPDAGISLCAEDGFCDESCLGEPDPDCGTDGPPDDAGTLEPTPCLENRTINEYWEIQEIPLGSSDCLTIGEAGSGVLAIVGDEFLQSLDFGVVREIFGSVLIQNDDNISSINATALEVVHGSLTIDDNLSLSFVDVPALTLVEGDVGIWRNPSLVVDPRFASLPTNGTLRVSANGCLAVDSCTPFGTPSCGYPGLSDLPVCYECADDSVCGSGVCDVEYTGPGTGTFTCVASGGADGTGDAGIPSVDAGPVDAGTTN